MHNREKYPEIWAAMESAKAELAPLMEKRKGYTDKIDECGTQIAKLIEKKEALNEKAMEDFARIKELRQEISRMAKAMGARNV